MFIRIIFFKEKKKAGLMALFTGLLTIGFLFAAAFVSLNNFHKENNFIKADAVVTYIDFSDKNNPHTEFTYECENKEYSVRHKSYSYRRKVGTEVKLLCYPSDPAKFVIVDDMGILPRVHLIISAITLIFSLPMLINYLIVLIRDKRVKD